jgi:hypothetical protein
MLDGELRGAPRHTDHQAACCETTNIEVLDSFFHGREQDLHASGIQINGRDFIEVASSQRVPMFCGTDV